MTTYTVTKISELTNLAAIPEDTDELVINDATVTKAIAAGYLRRAEVRDITSSGAQSGAGASHLHLVLNHAAGINYTITGAPTVGDVLTIYAATTANHTVILSGSVTFDGTNETATLNAAGDCLYAVAFSATRWHVISNTSVTFS